MKEINKLVGMVTSGLKSNYGVIDLTGESTTAGKEQLLFNGVLEGDYQSDESAAKGMYETDIYDQRFRMLKSRLRHKLYDLIYHLDFESEDYSYSTQIELEGLDYIHKAVILCKVEDISMADKQVNKAINLAIENQMPDLLVKAYELKREILSIECKPTDFDLLIADLAEVRVIAAIEGEATDIFLKAKMFMTKSIHSRNTCQGMVADSINSLTAMWKKTNSFNIYQQLYRTKIWEYLLEMKYDKLFDYTQRVEEEVKKMKVNQERFDWGYNGFVATRALLSSERYKEGCDLAKDNYKKLDKSTDQWFAHSENYFLLALHDLNLKLAKKILDNVLKNPNYGRASTSIVSRWKVFRIYLNFALPENDKLKRVRFSEVHASTDAYYLEAKGYYMSLPLLEFIHNLNKNRMDQAIEKLNEAENYYFKHLNEPGKNPREKQLFKMIKVLRDNDYDVDKTKEKAEKYFSKLGEKKTYYPFSDFEIIEYEHLWTLILTAVTDYKKANG